MSVMDITYSKENPFVAPITARYRLNHPGSDKGTYHLVLDLKDSNVRYSVGDSVAILPDNDPSEVTSTLHVLNANSDLPIVDKRSGTTYSLLHYLTRKGNISSPSKTLLKTLLERLPTTSLQRPALETLLSDGNKPALVEYLDSHSVWEVLKQHSEAPLTPQELCDLLPPLLPRFYSIASAMAHVGEELHLTVAHRVFTLSGKQRRGVCTDFLCERAPLNTPCIPLYIQPTHSFSLPEDNSIPIIMIGPGTGVAPFRAFLQERIASNVAGPHWLFFGERKQQHDFLYGDYWKELEAQGCLRLDTAFSRDQENKVYVQHRMLEKGAELWSWLQQGAHLYVCGDASKMAKDVEATLLTIVQEQGSLDKASASAFIKKLRADKRYLRDVY